MENHPRGGGADGEGGWRRPPPLSPVFLVERYSSTTPTARPLRGLLPPPREGAGKCLAIAPDSRAMGGERIFQECQVRPRRDCQIPGHCIDGESPPWEGAEGEGGGTSPAPVARVSPGRSFIDYLRPVKPSRQRFHQTRQHGSHRLKSPVWRPQTSSPMT